MTSVGSGQLGKPLKPLGSNGHDLAKIIWSEDEISRSTETGKNSIQWGDPQKLAQQEWTLITQENEDMIGKVQGARQMCPEIGEFTFALASD